MKHWKKDRKYWANSVEPGHCIALGSYIKLDWPATGSNTPVYNVRLSSKLIEILSNLSFSTDNLNDYGYNVQNQQNNFIQINGITVTAQQLQKLPAEKQRQVKEILELVWRWGFTKVYIFLVC